MYQAVPQPTGPSAEVLRVVLVLDVPRGPEVSSRAVRLTDEFGVTLARLIPGVRAHPAVLSEPSSATHPPAADESPGLTIDLTNRRVIVDGRPLRLAYREFELLAHLAAAPGRAVSRSALLQLVWWDHPDRERISARTVDTHIRRLRVKLGDHAHVLTTVRGRGYRFDPGDEVRLRAGPLPRRPIAWGAASR